MTHSYKKTIKYVLFWFKKTSITIIVTVHYQLTDFFNYTV